MCRDYFSKIAIHCRVNGEVSSSRTCEHHTPMWCVMFSSTFSLFKDKQIILGKILIQKFNNTNNVDLRFLD